MTELKFEKDRTKHVLVVGDFMIDQAWITKETEDSGTEQKHDSVKPKKRKHPTWNDKRLGGAGMIFMALRTLCKRETLDCQIHGLGIWHLNDDNLIRSLINEDSGNTNNEVALFRLKVTNEDDIVTTIKSRIYSQNRDDEPILESCYAQESHLNTLPSFEKDPLPNTLKKYLSDKNVVAIVVADFNKGTIQAPLLKVLQEHLSSECLWFIDSKNPKIYQLLPQGIRVDTLTMNRIEAVRLAKELGDTNIDSIPYDNRIWEVLRIVVNNLSERLSITLRTKDITLNKLVIKLDIQGACLYLPDVSTEEDDFIVSQLIDNTLDGDAIAAGDFFNASLLLDILGSSSLERTLTSACLNATYWLRSKKDYWLENHSNNEKSDIVRAGFFLEWWSKFKNNDELTRIETISCRLNS